MTPATEADRVEIEACLAPHAHQAMFPLNNLALHGMAGGHPHAVRFWLGRREGRLTDVLTLTEGGMVLPFLPSQDFAAAAQALRGQPVSGLNGVAPWVRGLAALLGLQGKAYLDADDDHFLLETSDLILPDGPGQIVPLAEAPEDVVRSWLLSYQIEALQMPQDQAVQRADWAYSSYVAAGSHVVLMDQGRPLAMAGFNAWIPGMVQIGGVYTPPELRGQGLAGRAVALHLRASGAGRATLFSSGPSAARAYRRIGFRPVGTWALILLQSSEVIHG